VPKHHTTKANRVSRGKDPRIPVFGTRIMSVVSFTLRAFYLDPTVSSA